MPAISPIILSYKKTIIDDEFKGFLKKYNPLGLIIMQDSCHNPEQLSRFVADFRDCVGREDAPVSIDQEGGKVQRLGGTILFDNNHQKLDSHPGGEHWPYFPAAALLGEIYHQDTEMGKKVSYQAGKALGSVLASLKIDLDFAPVIDLPIPQADKIISDRAFDNDAHVINLLAQEYVNGLHHFGVKSCVKHLPGHGRALVDSHKSLPVINNSLAELEQSDFIPVKHFNNSPWAMVGHVVMSAIDKNNPATQSSRIINGLLREEFGYQGVLCTDCIWMEALSGSLPERAMTCQKAGNDVIVAVHGNLNEQAAIMDALEPLSDISQERLQRANGQVPLAKMDGIAEVNWKKEFTELENIIHGQGLTIEESH